LYQGTASALAGTLCKKARLQPGRSGNKKKDWALAPAALAFRKALQPRRDCRMDPEGFSSSGLP
jgi:hypothetical protein